MKLPKFDNLIKPILRQRKQLLKRWSKRNKLSTLYTLIGISLLGSLLFSIVLLCANANSNYLYNQQRTENLKTRQSLIQALQAVQAQKVDTDTANAQKASTEAELKAKIDDLNGQLQAKAAASAEAARVAAIQAPVYTGYGGSATGPLNYSNTYAWGNCTWFVASVKSVPGNLGNANTWDDMAIVDGGSVSYTPFIGAIAQTDAGGYGHVALVIGVGNGTVTVREMNVMGLGVIDEASYAVGYFKYISI